MNVLYGPRMYYSLFGVRGLVTGARARLSPAPIIMAVAVRRLAHPVYLRARTTDVALCREIFLDGLYEAEFCEAPRVIVDAGANIGLSSVFYADEFPEARIIAIEPEASNYEMLLKNIAPYPGITPVHAALWKGNGVLNLCDTGAGNTTFQVSDAGDPGWTCGAGRVPAMTLKKIMTDYDLDRIDLLKIDVEGAEKEIFEHSSGWIDRVGLIAVELHDWIRSGISESVRRATMEFQYDWQRGDVTYLARSQDAVRLPQVTEQRPEGSPRSASRFPFKILSMQKTKR
jgi:FkbM family methyltransferase